MAVICDHCGELFHYWCVDLQGIPDINYYCDACNIEIENLNLNDNNNLDPIENNDLLLYL